MTYPEKFASYKHQPKFLDRAMAEEKRADGGKVWPQTETTDEEMHRHADMISAANTQRDNADAEPVVVTDPDYDRFDRNRSGPAYSKGSQGALQEEMESVRSSKAMNQSGRNAGQGPTRRRAANPNEGD